jgi:hypothetical protein
VYSVQLCIMWLGRGSWRSELKKGINSDREPDQTPLYPKKTRKEVMGSRTGARQTPLAESFRDTDTFVTFGVVFFMLYFLCC